MLSGTMTEKPAPNRGAQLLHNWRRRSGMTQAKACLVVGLDYSAYSKLETGSRVPGYQLALRIFNGTGGAVPLLAWSQAPKPERQKAA
jgi:transcriptional regulator with XRE-family HTH domain